MCTQGDYEVSLTNKTNIYSHSTIHSRWQPITPFGVPHRVMADDVYNGMHIPKGAMVFANTQ